MTLGSRHLVAFIDVGNAPYLEASGHAGLLPWSLRIQKQYGFGLLRTVRFVRAPQPPAGAAPAGSAVR